MLLVLNRFARLEPEDGPELPTKANEEFRPFIRRLPEFKFWYSVSKSTVIALFCTFFEVFNVPVFWPILVMYFITLFCLTMKRQIKVCALCWILLSLTYLTTKASFFYLAYDKIPLHTIHSWETQVPDGSQQELGCYPKKVEWINTWLNETECWSLLIY